MISKWIRFINKDLWRFKLSKHTTSKQWWLVKLRIVVLTIRGFKEDQCSLRASSLTFYTLISIVPVLALVFGVAKSFGYDKNIEEILLQKFDTQKEALNWIIGFAKEAIKQTHFGFIAGFGAMMLFFSVVKMLANIENAFNHIWGIKKTRSLMRKVGDYLAFILITPLLLVLGITMTVFVQIQIVQLAEKLSLSHGTILNFQKLFVFSPYLVMWILFIFVCKFMPNTHVKWKGALIGGVISGTLFQIVQVGFVYFQQFASSFGEIYGSFAVLPLFLIWLQISWLIVLFGGEISFAYQNLETYEYEQDCNNISHTQSILLALLITRLVFKRFMTNNAPLSSSDIAHELDMPVRLARQLVFNLETVGIFRKIASEDKTQIYQPAKDISDLRLKEVIYRLEHLGSDYLLAKPSVELERLKQKIRALDEQISQSDDNLLIKNI